MAANAVAFAPLLTFVRSVSMASYCTICRKDFNTRKQYTDHRRAMHALFYVRDSGESRLSSLPPRCRLTPTTASTHLLARRMRDKQFLCHECDKPCGKTTTAAKRHYLFKHDRAITISSKDPTPGLPLKTSPLSAPSSPLAEDVDMEDDDAAWSVHLPQLAVPSFDVGARGDESSDPQSDEDDEWDIESVLSDASTEVLVEEDEDDVVPRSFSLSAFTDPSLHGDCLKPDGQLPEPSLKSEEEPAPPSAGVYGSDSECLRPLQP